MRVQFIFKTLFVFFLTFPTSFTAKAIDEIEPGLVYTKRVVSPDGEAVCYNMVRVTKSNFEYWESYSILSDWISTSVLNRIYISIQSRANEKDQLFRSILGLDDQTYNTFKGHITSAPSKPSLLFSSGADRSVLQGVAGMAQVFTEFKKKPPADTRQLYMAFVSTHPWNEMNSQPVSRQDCSDVPQKFKEFRDAFGPIILSVPVIHNPRAPVSTHFGIFRNPLSFHDRYVSSENRLKSPGVSMKLHGFAACVEKRYFEGNKQYMSSWPTESMMEIFKQNIPAEALHIGTSKTCPEKYGKSPPLFYDSGEEDFVRNNGGGDAALLLINPGNNVAIKNFKPSESGDNILFYPELGERYEFSHYTIGEERILIDLEPLMDCAP